MGTWSILQNQVTLILKQAQFLIIFCFLSFCTCIRTDSELELDFDHDKMPVLYCFLHPDSIVSAHLFYSKAPLDNATTYLRNPVIVLYHTNTPIDTFADRGKGFYQSSKSLKPVVGASYRLVITSPDLEVPIETDFEAIPESPILDSICIVDSATMEIEVFNQPIVRLFPNPNNKIHYCVYALEHLFPFEGTIDASDFFFEASQDCNPGKIAFRYGGFRGKDISCIDQTVNLGWNTSGVHLNEEKYRFSWGVVNEGGARFFESSATYTELGEEALFFQPSTVESNISGAFGVFTAFNTSDYTFRF